MNGGKNERWAVDMAKAEWQAGTQNLQNKATAGGHSRQTLRPAQASRNKQPQMAGLAAKTTAADDVGRPLAVQCR